ncbi:hypothetical protein FSARC_356 [Fusarium sarcochroum]|uniref:Uncharacterized protein n=1 Tax=Fusarium sarcochroum TaxID=1208366 RepID=A0A8H4UBC4_9HYPO|nr:hypothetical protein FSARC_356 [Fusarium sarcochroum]
MAHSEPRLPAWYYRVSVAVRKRNGVILWDFDEDISDLDETNQDGETQSYDGPDAAYYYELRKKREERKRELHRRKEHIRKLKEDAREAELKKQQEVQTAYEAFEITISSGGKNYLGPLDSQFDLFCLDYFDRFYDPSLHGYQRKYIKFQYPEGQQEEGRNVLLNGRLWLNPNVDYELGPFSPPEQASLDHFKLKTIDDRFTLALQFIDKDHLILRISRNLVFMDKPQDASGPETFIFMGVRNDFGKLLQTFGRAFAQIREASSDQPT